jgi:methylenetetrahydrofolate dehydrogenase (NADP+)/methenyltetrahydrofolate cyclohydrolase
MILNGKAIAQKIEERIVQSLQHTERPPGIAFVLIGENPASHTYIRMKRKKCKEVGMISFDREFPEDISESALLQEIHQLNLHPDIDGILVQLPLPLHLSAQRITEAISPEKDVDGFHPVNVGKMLLGEHDGFLPCTPHGILVMLFQSNIKINGQHVVIVGRSNIVGKPLAALLMQKSSFGNATVTVAHSYTQNLTEICRSADILIAATGQPNLIKKEMVKTGAVVVDVGINRIVSSEQEIKLVGDVDFEEVAPLCSYITPVPGGVGPMTIAMLLSNTLLSYQRRRQMTTP